MSIDHYFERRYHRQNYNCLAFSSDVFYDLTGLDIREALGSLLGAVSERKVTRGHLRAFTRLARPVGPCLVLMQRPRATPHVGVYLRGRVLHILDRGVEYQPLEVAASAFTSVRFYSCKK